MNYRETIEWLYGQLPAYQKIGGTAMKSKLVGIQNLLDRLGRPEKNWASVHVAGTNGKGSSSHMLAAILQKAGYKVGLYTSPHLKDFRERIRVDGVCISEEEVVGFVARYKEYFAKEKPSFFEMTVGMAFWYFSEMEVDIAVVEVGLGGRLDSTNVIQPEVCLITNIGMDHKDLLGDSLQQIAFEKAGIIKSGIPVVISEQQEVVSEVFREVAQNRGAPLVFAPPVAYETDLLGMYQQKNIQGVVATIKALDRFPVGEKAIEEGLMNVVSLTGLQGRWQVLELQPKIICDTAHNTEGLSITMVQLAQEKCANLHIVFGVVKEKELQEILSLLPKEARYYFCAPNIYRALPALDLQGKALENGLDGTVYDSVAEAYAAARNAAGLLDCIYVGGSTFVVAEVL
ncbi:MAG: bifunctional folylpolyglutamate synthase/dihydrofolate synthase [Flavobacteriaceae bacterium]|nr:bifunctional folylpolyglutamate synthase/dihydrofolate synthase [Flavobacteriaceae bacterium]